MPAPAPAPSGGGSGGGGGGDGVTVYRLAPLVVARFVGLALVVLALLVFVGTAVIAVAGLSLNLLVVLVLVAAVAVGVLAWWLRNRAWLVRCTDRGYRVRLVRGAGTLEARWKDVEDVVATSRTGLGQEVPCLVLRLRDGRTTTIPVGLLEVDKDQFARDLQGRLQRGSGLRPA
jgi:hypothetical protein